MLRCDTSSIRAARDINKSNIAPRSCESVREERRKCAELHMELSSCENTQDAGVVNGQVTSLSSLRMRAFWTSRSHPEVSNRSHAHRNTSKILIGILEAMQVLFRCDNSAKLTRL